MKFLRVHSEKQVWDNVLRFYTGLKNKQRYMLFRYEKILQHIHTPMFLDYANQIHLKLIPHQQVTYNAVYI